MSEEGWYLFLLEVIPISTLWFCYWIMYRGLGKRVLELELKFIRSDASNIKCIHNLQRQIDLLEIRMDGKK